MYCLALQIQAEERYGPQGYVYISQGHYEPIGGPEAATQQFTGQAPYQGTSGGNEIYAGQGSYQQQGQHVQPSNSKGAPPPYGAV